MEALDKIQLDFAMRQLKFVEGRNTYSWQYEGIGNLGVQRAWSEIMIVLTNQKGSIGRWNLNFWKLEQFYTIFWSKGVVDTYSKP
jgi:hypothetical protein